jgi:hypothetical protein
MQAAAAAHAVNAAVNTAANHTADAHVPDALAAVLEAARAQAASTAGAAQPGQAQAVHAAAAAATVSLAAAEAGRGRQWAADAAALHRAGEAVYKASRTTRLVGGHSRRHSCIICTYVLVVRNLLAADAKVAENTDPSS